MKIELTLTSGEIEVLEKQIKLKNYPSYYTATMLIEAKVVTMIRRMRTEQILAEKKND